MSEENKCNLIDIRDAVELQREGRIENSFHISRGLLEFAVHPDSPYAKKENKYQAFLRLHVARFLLPLFFSYFHIS